MQFVVCQMQVHVQIHEPCEREELCARGCLGPLPGFEPGTTSTKPSPTQTFSPSREGTDCTLSCQLAAHHRPVDDPSPPAEPLRGLDADCLSQLDYYHAY